MIGTQVGQYAITQEIGDGGHAFVFRGEGGGRQVAIKMLKPSVADEDNLEKRFVIEAEALKELSHPFIVGFHDYIFMNGYHYLVLEYMDQGSVEDLLDTMGPIPHRYAIPIFYKVLQAMQFSHERNYIHRDMKPNNILINSEGEAKLTDFGIAKVVGGGQNLTQKGFVLGTTLYMAPEFISQGKVTIQTDIYALGVTFYEMLTNRKPFEFEREDEPLVNFARRVCKGEPTPPSQHVDIPRELERIVLKSIAQTPKERYKSAAEFAKDLAKHYPDLVNRAIVIPKGTGRAMTRYVNLEEEGLRELAPDAGHGTSSTGRLALALVTAVALFAIFYFLPTFVPALKDSLSPSALIGIAAGLSVTAGAILFAVRGSKDSKSEEWIRSPEPRAAAQAESSDSGLSSSELDGFGSEDDSSAFDIDMEDTIPFQDPGVTNIGKPFKMTDVSELEAYLVVESGPDEGRRFGLRPVSRIGRDLRLDLRPHDPEISRHHAVLTFDGTGFTAEDLGSTNGTYVNEERLTGKVRLTAGDVVRVGSTKMRFEFRT